MSDPPDTVELKIELGARAGASRSRGSASRARRPWEVPRTMCLTGQLSPAPATAADAAAMAQAALGWLAKADVASLTTAEQADCLRALEQAAAMQTAARSRVLAAFHAQDGCADDGHGSTRTWPQWQTPIT